MVKTVFHREAILPVIASIRINHRPPIFVRHEVIGGGVLSHVVNNDGSALEMKLS